MITYAQIEDNKVVGISQLSGSVDANDMMDVSELEPKPKLGSIYNPSTNEFSEPEIQEPDAPALTLEELQTQTLLNTEYLVVMSELSNI